MFPKIVFFVILRLRVWNTCFCCDYTKEIWDFFFLRSPISPSSRFEDILTWCNAPSTNYKLNLICKLLLQATIYEIWKQRNSRLHNSASRTGYQIIKDIQLILRAKMAVLDRTSSSTSSCPTQEAHSFLYYWFQSFQHPSRFPVNGNGMANQKCSSSVSHLICLHIISSSFSLISNTLCIVFHVV